MLIRYCDSCNKETPEVHHELTSRDEQNLLRVDFSSYGNDNDSMFPLAQGDGWKIATFMLCRECSRKLLDCLNSNPSVVFDSRQLEELKDK